MVALSLREVRVSERTSFFFLLLLRWHVEINTSEDAIFWMGVRPEDVNFFRTD